MLSRQYRMHEDIMQFSSRYFYKNELVADDRVSRALLRPNQSPVVFIDTAGAGYADEQDPETLSRFNTEEATLVIGKIEQLVEEVGMEEWLKGNFTIGIITPVSCAG